LRKSYQAKIYVHIFCKINTKSFIHKQKIVKICLSRFQKKSKNPNLISFFYHPQHEITSFHSFEMALKRPIDTISVLFSDETCATSQLYFNKIFYRYYDLIVRAEKKRNDLSFYDLALIFEYYSCLVMTEQCGHPFFHFEDIAPSDKELNGMTQRDTGIDFSDLQQTIGQCKLRQKKLTWKECGTFFGSQNIFDTQTQSAILRWKKLVIVRNDSCSLSTHLQHRLPLFKDVAMPIPEMLDFCDSLLHHQREEEEREFVMEIRPYQTECRDLILNQSRNLALCLPTGSGKNFIVLQALTLLMTDTSKRFLVLVPRIILMDQFADFARQQLPELADEIQLVGDNHNHGHDHLLDFEKRLTICVYNSVGLVADHVGAYDKIFVDEAHHIAKPEIYFEDDDDFSSENDDDVLSEEDEVRRNSTYLDIISDLRRFDNNVYLSATLDEIDGFDYYKKELREMIESGYLADYNIHIPIFTEDVDNRKVCAHLLHNYRSIIVYCHSRQEGMEVRDVFNEIQRNSCEYIDCMTGKRARQEILGKFRSGEIPFLVNVRVLVEGFDAPITKGVCFLHLPTNKTAAIQIIGRSLRLHADKKLASVILPFSKDEDGSSVSSLLNILASNDMKIKMAMTVKRGVGGYIDMNIIVDEDLSEKDDYDDDEDESEEEADVSMGEFRFNLIFDRIGTCLNGGEMWMKRLEDLRTFLETEKRRPSHQSKNENERRIGVWLSNQLKNYKNCAYIMKDDRIRERWNAFVEEYSDYFLSNEEIWMKSLFELKLFMSKEKKRPCERTKNADEKRIANWLKVQLVNYKKTVAVRIMKHEKIRRLFESFVDEYAELFLANEEIWMKSLEELKSFMSNEKKRPCEDAKFADEKRIAFWLSLQLRNYKKTAQIMKVEKIRQLFESFVDEYAEFFLSNEAIWMKSLEELKSFMSKEKKRPCEDAKFADEKRIALWLSVQLRNYKKTVQIMKVEKIRQFWKDFVDQYAEFFLSNEEIWMKRCEDLRTFLETEKRRPSYRSKNEDEKRIGKWMSHQVTNYKKTMHIMKVEKIRQFWKDFVDQYAEYFI